MRCHSAGDVARPGAAACPPPEIEKPKARAAELSVALSNAPDAFAGRKRGARSWPRKVQAARARPRSQIRARAAAPGLPAQADSRTSGCVLEL